MTFADYMVLGTSPKWAPVADRAYWTEIRPYAHYMIIGSELEGNGIQIFDMKKARSRKKDRHRIHTTNEALFPPFIASWRQEGRRSRAVYQR